MDSRDCRWYKDGRTIVYIGKMHSVAPPPEITSKAQNPRAGVLVLLSNGCNGRPGSQFRTAVKRPGISSIRTSSQSWRCDESFHNLHPTYHSLITLDRLTPSVMSRKGSSPSMQGRQESVGQGRPCKSWFSRGRPGWPCRVFCKPPTLSGTGLDIP